MSRARFVAAAGATLLLAGGLALLPAAPAAAGRPLARLASRSASPRRRQVPG